MNNLKVLIADDSVVYRSQIRAALQGLPGIEVVGAVSNGRIALERISQVLPDLLILDLEMPEMDGLQTLKEMRERGITSRVIVFSAASKRGAESALESLRLGASDFIAKPGAQDASDSLTSGNPTERVRLLILPKILALFPEREGATAASAASRADEKYPNVIWDIFKPDIIVIGSSTGGPTVLEKIFSSLESGLHCPVVIVQHMPPIFTTTFAERLGRIGGLPAVEASEGMTLEKGKIYLAPGDYHLRLKGNKARTQISLDQGPQIHSVRPAVDYLFETAAEIFKERCLAFVLTGMGYDGKRGAIAVKKAGGAVVIQSEKSCSVFGMPGSVFSVGAYDKIADPAQITDLIRDKAGVARVTPLVGGKGA